MINTVIFDLGKVLVDFHPVEGMKKLGFSKEAIEIFCEKIFPEFWEECDKRPISDEEIRRIFKERLPGFEEEVDTLWDNLPVVTGLYDYSCEWVHDLKERGYRIYILSNFGQRAFEINSQVYTFLKDVDGKVVSYEVCMTKPDPEIYNFLAKKYGINPTEAVFIDDRKINVDGAIACGFKSILFENYEQAKDELERMLREK